MQQRRWGETSDLVCIPYWFWPKSKIVLAAIFVHKSFCIRTGCEYCTCKQHLFQHHGCANVCSSFLWMYELHVIREKQKPVKVTHTCTLLRNRKNTKCLRSYGITTNYYCSTEKSEWLGLPFGLFEFCVFINNKFSVRQSTCSLAIN